MALTTKTIMERLDRLEKLVVKVVESQERLLKTMERLENESNEQPGELSDDLLEKPSSELPDDQPDEQNEALEDFFRFMQRREQHNPYAKYLFRAHNLGRRDNGSFSDAYGADFDVGMQLQNEWSLNTAVNDISGPEAIFSQLRMQLSKTQNQNDAKAKRETPEKTRLVSLSDSFVWTVQRTCCKHRENRGDQVGLAIFETASIRPAGTHLFRVDDLLAYLDQSPCRESITIEEAPRRWARNCGEYVCWSLIPKEALIAFVPEWKLRAQTHMDTPFLQPRFAEARHIRDFLDSSAPETLSPTEYFSRVRYFLRGILSRVVQHYDIEQLDATLLSREWFARSMKSFGYNVPGLPQNHMLVYDTVASELRWAAENRRPTAIMDANLDRNITPSLAALSMS